MTSLIYIHSSWRTSSTWFFFKFRSLSETECFNEPFNEDLMTITRAKALSADYRSWDSRHPPSDPYYVEYLPLISDAGGVQLFEARMPFDWFIPCGGLRGELRPSEKRYLQSIIRHAERRSKIPVFADTRTLGRLRAVKSAFGGYHIFLHRNLWKQWLSYIYYKRRGIPYFYETVARLTARDDDPYLIYLGSFYTNRADELLRRGEGGKQRVESESLCIFKLLPEHSMFAMFMALHIYFYLHSQLAADLSVDVTRMARDTGYRSDIERELRRHTGLAVLLSDVTDEQSFGGVHIDIGAINWDEIKGHAYVAVSMLAEFGDREKLTVNATAFIDATLNEMQKSAWSIANLVRYAQACWRRIQKN